MRAEFSFIIAELAVRSPIIIQNSSNLSSRKNLDVRPYDRTTAQGATLTSVFNCTAGTPTPTPRLCSVVQWSVYWAPSWATRFQSWPGQGVVPLRRAGKKKRAPLLGLAKSIYYNLRILRPDIKCIPGVALLKIF